MAEQVNYPTFYDQILFELGNFMSTLNRRGFMTKALVSAVMLACVPFAQAADMKSVAVTAIVDHPALDAARKGVEDELKAAGFVAGKNLKYQYQSAQGNAATAGQIARKFVGDKPDVVVAIATPSAQALAAATKSIPIVFTAVTDPIGAKLVKSQAPSNGNITGVSDQLTLSTQIDLMQKVKPSAKKIGMVFSPGEINSTVIVKELKTELSKRGMTLVEVPAPRSVDIPSAARSLKGKVDLVYTTTDNNVVSAYESLVRVAQEMKVPLVAADPDSVKRGASAALGMSYYDLGRQTGKVVVRILNGEKAGSIPFQIGEKTVLTVNPKAAKAQGLTLSQDLLKEAKDVIQ